MYSFDELRSGLSDPRKIALELNRIYHRQIRGRTGVKIMAEDWDTLILLDACRYDLFEEENTIDGELRSVISADSSTSGFLKYNFDGRTFSDTVYVSANPQVQRHGADERFYKCFRLWTDDWNDELHTVLPEKVTDRAVEAHERYPNKRVIVHYVQPHYPFIGETGLQFDHGCITGDGVISDNRDVGSVWDQLANGTVQEETVRTAYRENLKLVLPEVEKLLDQIDGKSVITSDHGNAFGEWGIYGHPGGVFLSSLVKVPWLKLNDSSRRTIKEGKISEKTGGDTTDVSDRLEDLGYLQ